MHDQLAECCAREFECHVDELVRRQQRGQILVTSPIFTGSFSINNVPKLKLLVRNALRARALYARHGPPHLQPLPLSQAEYIVVFGGDSSPLYVVGMYSRSLQGRDYDFLGHPQFFDYARAVMADPRFECLRDPELQREFPEKPLVGLDGRGRWRPLPDRASKLIESPILEAFI